MGKQITIYVAVGEAGQWRADCRLGGAESLLINKDLARGELYSTYAVTLACPSRGAITGAITQVSGGEA